MMRLDKELVNRNLVSSRSKAQELISNKCIKVNDKVITKDSFDVKDEDKIEVLENDITKYVSRGGLKLEHALDVFNIDFNGKHVFDIGSSTGGFTDCSLKHGASFVRAIDVGTNLMVESLRNDSRVELHENLNLKEIPDSYFDGIDYVVTDVSFISLKRVIDKVSPFKVDMVVLIKPQFECGKEIADKYKGIILDKEVHKNILNDMINYFNNNGYVVKGLDVSSIRGGDGNIEYVSYISTYGEEINLDIDNIVNKAFWR